jgi:hypothetical protein
MSAPTTHDPRFVNTRDGVCWERRAVTDSGLGLYAVEGSCKCPPFKMATLAELAEHGIVGSADVLPMPVGPKPRTLDVVEDELTGVSLSLYEEERASERLRWALASAKRGRARLRAQVAELEHTVQQMVEGLNGHDCPPPDETPLQAVTRFAVRLMEAERLLAEDGCSCPPAVHPHQVGCPLDLPAPGSSERPVNELTQSFAPVAALREDVSPQVEKLRALLGGQRVAVEDPHDSPLHHDYRLGHDLPESGGGGRD